MKISTAALLATTATLAVGAAPAYAQSDSTNQGQAPAAPASQASGTASDGDIVITARRTNEHLQQTPLAVTALTAATLENAGIDNLEDITTLAPSFQAAPAPNNSGTPLISIRGVLTNEFAPNFDPAVGIYLDGVYAGTTIGGLVTNYLDVERVEILRGPQGTLFGRNSTGGAFTIYTRLPTDRFEGQFGIGYGNFDRSEAWGVVNVPLTEGAALRVVGNYLDTNGYGRDTVNNRQVADQHSLMLRGTLRLTPGPNTEIILRADWQNARSNGPLMRLAALRAGSLANQELALTLFGANNATTQAAALAFQQARAAGSPFLTGYSLPTSDRNEIWGTSATVSQEFGDFTLRSISAYRSTEAGTHGQRSPFAQVTYNEQVTGAHQFTQEVQLIGNLLDGRLSSVSGLYYFEQAGFETSTFFQFPRLGTVARLFFDSDSYAHSYAAYNQETFELLPSVHLTGGLRYTHETKRVVTRNRNLTANVCGLPPSLLIGGVCQVDRSLTFEDLAYTASIDWRITPSVMIYARTSNGFKSGGLPHRVSLDPQTSDPFLPEDVTDYEIGFKSRFLENRIRLNVAAYYADYTNIQRTVLTPGFSPGSPPTTATKNAASARIQGFEVEFNAVPVPNLELGATVAYTDAHYRQFLSLGVDQSGQLFQNVPKWTYSLSAAYTVPLGFADLRAQANWYWRDQADMFPAGGDLRPARVQEAYGLLSARLSLQIEHPNLEIALWGRNLTDKVYFNAAFDNFATAGTINQYIAEPRTYGLQGTFRF
jgi:iron complex outermembrane receptor protein